MNNGQWPLAAGSCSLLMGTAGVLDRYTASVLDRYTAGVLDRYTVCVLDQYTAGVLAQRTVKSVLIVSNC
ncbi:MAG: hypothetical protein LBK61_00130 [Spirochaetaceae bacterium]|nr:hypothetical protein [Spirochaetaceae bacterium]